MSASKQRQAEDLADLQKRRSSNGSNSSRGGGAKEGEKLPSRLLKRLRKMTDEESQETDETGQAMCVDDEEQEDAERPTKADEDFIDDSEANTPLDDEDGQEPSSSALRSGAKSEDEDEDMGQSNFSKVLDKAVTAASGPGCKTGKKRRRFNLCTSPPRSLQPEETEDHQDIPVADMVLSDDPPLCETREEVRHSTTLAASSNSDPDSGRKKDQVATTAATQTVDKNAEESRFEAKDRMSSSSSSSSSSSLPAFSSSLTVSSAPIDVDGCPNLNPLVKAMWARYRASTDPFADWKGNNANQKKDKGKSVVHAQGERWEDDDNLIVTGFPFVGLCQPYGAAWIQKGLTKFAKFIGKADRVSQVWFDDSGIVLRKYDSVSFVRFTISKSVFQKDGLFSSKPLNCAFDIAELAATFPQDSASGAPSSSSKSSPPSGATADTTGEEVEAKKRKPSAHASSSSSASSLSSSSSRKTASGSSGLAHFQYVVIQANERGIKTYHNSISRTRSFSNVNGTQRTRTAAGRAETSDPLDPTPLTGYHVSIDLEAGDLAAILEMSKNKAKRDIRVQAQPDSDAGQPSCTFSVTPTIKTTIRHDVHVKGTPPLDAKDGKLETRVKFDLLHRCSTLFETRPVKLEFGLNDTDETADVTAVRLSQTHDCGEICAVITTLPISEYRDEVL